MEGFGWSVVGRVAPIIVAVLASIGCAGPRYQAGEWPQDVPAESYFAAAYESDATNADRQSLQEYFDWVLRFYKGNGLVPGWRSQEETLAKILGDDAAALAPEISQLGRVVAGEWAKHNEVRRIDSDMLMLWGNVLKRAAREGRASSVVEKLTGDAQAVIAGELAKSAIGKDRYADVLARK